MVSGEDGTLGNGEELAIGVAERGTGRGGKGGGTNFIAGSKSEVLVQKKLLPDFEFGS